MYIINVTVGKHILHRAIADNLFEAKHTAKKFSREKIWRLEDNSVYFGDVTSKVYSCELNTTSDHIDEHIFSVTDTC